MLLCACQEGHEEAALTLVWSRVDEHTRCSSGGPRLEGSGGQCENTHTHAGAELAQRGGH